MGGMETRNGRAGGGAREARLLRIGVWASQRRRWGRDLIAGAFRHANREGRCEIRFFDEEDGDAAVRALRRWRPDGLVLSGDVPAMLRAPNRLCGGEALAPFNKPLPAHAAPPFFAWCPV